MSSLLREDTIVAISTPLGEGGIGIVRLSGPNALVIAEKIFVPTSCKSLQDFHSHTIHHGFVVDPLSGEKVDEALLSLMRSPRSYTTEDVVEISCHGGVVPLRQTLVLALQAGARLAEPGEFTLRAFLRGRIDLAQAEAVAEIIRARTERSLKFAFRNLEGALSREVRALKGEVCSLLSVLEAGVDFPEEELEVLTEARWEERLEALGARIEDLLRTAQDGRIYYEGVRVAIVGRPNVGKSSLLNALLGEDRAIVSPYPGTTRDTIEGYISLGGIPFCLVDTAGMRRKAEGLDPVEAEGLRRSRRSLEGAELLLLILDGSQALTVEDEAILEEARCRRGVVVINKEDLGLALQPEQVRERLGRGPILIASAKTGYGLDKVRDAMVEQALNGRVPLEEGAVVANLRHQEALARALGAIRLARESLKAGMSAEFLALDLKVALETLGEILGETASEDVLKEIFSRFCIGK